MISPRTFSTIALLVAASAAGCGRGERVTLGSISAPPPLADLPTVVGVISAPTCQSLGANCGPVGDGFGHVLSCGDCVAPQICGGGGVPSVCGGSMAACAARTCADFGYGCGSQGDGCGGEIACGVCGAGEQCGVAGPSQCGATALCSNLCLQQITCEGASTTTVSGTVVAPTDPAHFGNPDPLYGAVVYIPNAPVASFDPGVSCDLCGAEVSGSPLVLAHTGPDGTFSLLNAPVGKGIPLVIQLGRWRRQISIDVAPCTDNALTKEQTRLPRNQSEGDIPKMAMVTGSADPLECVLRKMGIADTEFTAPTAQGGTGRVQMFVSNGVNDASLDAPSADTLWNDPTELATFDMVLFACEGRQLDKPPTAQQNVIDFANLGGRVFATHFSYTWLYDDEPWSGTGEWAPGMAGVMGMSSVTGIVDTTFAKGLAFAQWLDVVGASTEQGSARVAIDVARRNLLGVLPPAQRWIYTASPDPTTVQHYTFDTPVGADESQVCGRVLYSDFHVTAENAGGGGMGPKDKSDVPFPIECDDAPLSPQERILEFALFDLSSCVEAGANGACVPATCQSLGDDCGPVGDGCGGLLDCGACSEGFACGAGSKPSVCAKTDAISCVPLTCEERGYHCGKGGDGCGTEIDCGACPAGQSCGGGGTPWVCGS